MANDLEPTAIQAVLIRVAGVQSCRIVQDESGRISEVHVLASQDRAPKQIVRDIQSVLMASFDVRVDHRIVSVVQLDTPPETTAEAANGVSAQSVDAGDRARAAITSIVSRSENNSSQVAIDLSLRGRTTAGQASGPSSAGLRLVAEAATEALRTAVADVVVRVLDADLFPVGGQQVAVVLLQIDRPDAQVKVVGSALVRRDVNDAIARATLAGINRLVAQ